MSLNFGLTPPPPPEEKSAVDPYPRPPVTVNEIRDAKARVEALLKDASRAPRTLYSPREVVDLLLDAYSILDRLTSPTQLIAMATQLAQESKAWETLIVPDSE